jgi:hypothetical protein
LLEGDAGLIAAALGAQAEGRGSGCGS